MSTIDIRDMDNTGINTIVFAETHGSVASDEDVPLAYQIVRDEDGDVSIQDTIESVFVSDKQHALNLIKALNKAIELGWLK